MRTAIKSVLALVCVWIAVVASAGAQEAREEAQAKVAKGPRADAGHIIFTPTRSHGLDYWNLTKANLINHGGPTITTAKVVFIFWGRTSVSAGSTGPMPHPAGLPQPARHDSRVCRHHAVLRDHRRQPRRRHRRPVRLHESAGQRHRRHRPGHGQLLPAFFPFDSSTVYEVVIPRLALLLPLRTARSPRAAERT